MSEYILDFLNMQATYLYSRHKYQQEWDKSQTLIRRNRKRDEKMRNRNIKINVFLNEDENKILNEKVKRSGLNKSEFFRKIILDYQLKEKPDEKFYEILSQLRGMATNLNQMARTYNKYQGYMREDKINPLLNKIQNFILALQEVYLIPQKKKNVSGW